MHSREYILFAIPILSMIGIGLYQILDESFKKEFILERRKKQAASQGPGPQRRYLDALATAEIGQDDLEGSAAGADVPVAQTHGA